MVAKFNLKKYLKGLSKEDLIKEIEKLSGKFKNVNEHYEAELSTDSSVILNRYKDAIQKEFVSKRRRGRPRIKLAVVRKLITDFTKIAVFEIDVTELILFRVETAVDFTLKYGELSEQFYTSAASYFDKVCRLVAKNRLQHQYKERCSNMIAKTRYLGLGFHHSLSNSWSIHCEENNDNIKAKLNK